MQVRIIELLNLTSPTVLFLFSLLFLIFCFIFLAFIKFLFTFFFPYLLSNSLVFCLICLHLPSLLAFYFFDLLPLYPHSFPRPPISSPWSLARTTDLYLQLYISSWCHHIISSPSHQNPRSTSITNHHSESWHYSPKYKELIKRNSCQAQLYYFVCQWEPSDGVPITLIWSHPLYFDLQYSLIYCMPLSEHKF